MQSVYSQRIMNKNVNRSQKKQSQFKPNFETCPAWPELVEGSAVEVSAFFSVLSISILPGSSCRSVPFSCGFTELGVHLILPVCVGLLKAFYNFRPLFYEIVFFTNIRFKVVQL